MGKDEGTQESGPTLTRAPSRTPDEFNHLHEKGTGKPTEKGRKKKKLMTHGRKC